MMVVDSSDKQLMVSTRVCYCVLLSHAFLSCSHGGGHGGGNCHACERKQSLWDSKGTGSDRSRLLDQRNESTAKRLRTRQIKAPVTSANQSANDLSDLSK